MAELETLQMERNAHGDAAAPGTTGAGTALPPIPSDALIIVPVRSFVLFPGTVMPVAVGRTRSIAAAQQALREQRQVGILMQRDRELDDPSPLDMHRMGTVANIVRYVTAPDGTHHLVCQGDQRFQIVEFLSGWPFFVARVTRVPEPAALTPEIEARFLHLQGQTIEALELLPQAPPELVGAIRSVTSPAALADLATAYMDVSPDEKQEVLETIDVVARMEKVSRMLAHRIEVLRLSAEIGKQTKAALDERQREVLLREQMAAIQRQLGEGDEGKGAEIAELSQAITKAGMPKEVEEQARKELRRLERMPDAAAEYGMIRTYLDWLIELPWALPEEKPIDIGQARRILDEDHFGLDKIKRRIVEYLAVRKLAPQEQGADPVLRRSARRRQDLARPVDRPRHGSQVRAREPRRRARRGRDPRPPAHLYRGAAGQHHPEPAQGGCPQLRHDARRDRQARTRRAGRPRRGVARGARSGAEQHVPRQLSWGAVRPEPRRVHHHRQRARHHSRAAARPDRDHLAHRLHRTEKLEIARALSRPPPDRGERAHGRAQLEITDAALRDIIQNYTREAGVRSLERAIGKVLRHAAVRIAEGQSGADPYRVDDVAPVLGPPQFESELAMRTSVPGVATGLAWTPVGGDILFIEATRIPGSGRLILTGQLGEVMQESAQAALSMVKNRAVAFGIDPATFKDEDIHVHVPAGAIPKDGPSAGVAMFMALVSLMSERTIRSDTAMTGEISLRGLVLPVGGIKEKVVAAARAGIRRVMLPARNRRDYDDIPEDVRRDLEFVWLERVDEAIAASLEAK